MSVERALRIAREEVDRMWVAEGQERQHNSLCIAMKYLMEVVEAQANTIERLDAHIAANLEKKLMAGA